MQAVRRLQRHGTGMEIRVPPDVCRELKAGRGDYMFFDWEPGDGSAKLGKVKFGARKNGKAKEAQAVIPTAISPRRSPER